MDTLAFDYAIPAIRACSGLPPVRQCSCRAYNEDGSDNLKETIEANYRKVKQEILTLVDSEIQRIKNTPALSHLIPDK